MDKQKGQTYTFRYGIENRQEFVRECPDLMLMDQITFAELSRRGPHTNPFVIVLKAINMGRRTVLGVRV
jgi:hypothetical protein